MVVPKKFEKGLGTVAFVLGILEGIGVIGLLVALGGAIETGMSQRFSEHLVAFLLVYC